MIYRSTGYGGTWLPCRPPDEPHPGGGMELLVSASPGLSHLLLPYSLPLRLCAFATLRSLLLSCLPLYPLRPCAFATLRSLLLVCLKHPNKTRGQSPRFFKHLLKFSRPSTYDHRDRPSLMLRFQKSPSNSARALQLAKPRLANLQNEMLP